MIKILHVATEKNPEIIFNNNEKKKSSQSYEP